MYKLLVVDDEEIVRSGVCSIIDWKSIGIGTVLQSEDGELGLELAKKEKPDIILTDIRMPFMDGINMSREVLKVLPQTKIVILSGHDEFEYARQSIKLGVVDYILKPISSANLTVLMTNIVSSLNEEREKEKNLARLVEHNRMGSQLMVKQFFNNLLQGSFAKAMEGQSYLNINLPEPPMVICIFEPNLYNFGNPEIVRRFERQMGGLSFVSHENKHCIVAGSSISLEALSELCDRLCDAYNIDIRIGIGEPVESVQELINAYESAKHALSYMVAISERRIFNIRELGYKGKEFIYPKQLIEELISQRHSYQNGVNNLVSYLADCKNLTVDNLKILLFDIITKAEKLGGDAALEDNAYLTLTYEVQDLASFKKRLMGYFGKLDQGNKSKSIVISAKQYIQKNFDDPNLSLNSVAEQIYVTPSYLSALFKKEFDLSFVDYVTTMRLEHAKKLVLQDELRNYEIAAKCGYKNPHYFSICFKKYTGLSPKEFKNEAQKSEK